MLPQVRTWKVAQTAKEDCQHLKNHGPWLLHLYAGGRIYAWQRHVCFNGLDAHALVAAALTT